MNDSLHVRSNPKSYFIVQRFNRTEPRTLCSAPTLSDFIEKFFDSNKTIDLSVTKSLLVLTVNSIPLILISIFIDPVEFYKKV